MNTATIFKEEIENPAVWDTIIRDLELPADTDELIIKSVSHITETQRKKSRNRSNKESLPASEQSNSCPTIQIIISGGAVQHVEKPAGIALEIRDYDVDDDDAEGNENCRQDEDGEWYQEMFWGEDEIIESNTQ